MLFCIKQKIYILYVGESGLTLRTVVTGRLDFKACGDFWTARHEITLFLIWTIVTDYSEVTF